MAPIFDIKDGAGLGPRGGRTAPMKVSMIYPALVPERWRRPQLSVSCPAGGSNLDHVGAAVSEDLRVIGAEQRVRSITRSPGMHRERQDGGLPGRLAQATGHS